MERDAKGPEERAPDIDSEAIREDYVSDTTLYHVLMCEIDDTGNETRCSAAAAASMPHHFVHERTLSDAVLGTPSAFLTPFSYVACDWHQWEDGLSIDIHVDDQEHDGFAGPMPTAENVIQAIHQDDVTILSLMLAEEPQLFKVGLCIKVRGMRYGRPPGAGLNQDQMLMM